MRIFPILAVLGLLFTFNCRTQKSKQEIENKLLLDTLTTFQSKLKECNNKKDSIQQLLQLARLSGQAKKDSTSFSYADKIIEMDPKNPYPHSLIKWINSSRKYASAGISGTYEMIPEYNGATMWLLVTDSSVLYYCIKIESNHCAGNIDDSAFFFNNSNAISYQFDEGSEEFCKISFSFRNDTVFIKEDGCLGSHGAECQFTGKYLKKQSDFIGKDAIHKFRKIAQKAEESSREETEKWVQNILSASKNYQNADQTSEDQKKSSKDEYALIIYHGCLGMGTSLSELTASCLYSGNIYYCGGYTGNPIKEGMDLNNAVINNEYEFYIVEGDVKKQISPESITRYIHDSQGSISNCNLMGYRIQITANINGKDYTGSLKIGISDGCFFIYRAKVVNEIIFGENHHILRNIEELQQWP